MKREICNAAVILKYRVAPWRADVFISSSEWPYLYQKNFLLVTSVSMSIDQSEKREIF